MGKIDRLVWAEGVCLESFGVAVGVRASRGGFLEGLAGYLPPCWRPIASPTNVDVLYSWVVGGEHKANVRAYNLMYAGGGRIARTLDRDELFEAFERNLRMTIALLSRKFVFIHAGAVGWRGRAIVMPGRTFVGKSTLVEAMVRAGAEYLSDEYALLDQDGRVHPYAKPLSLRADAARRASAIELASGRTVERPMEVGAILATRYRGDARSRFRRASAGRGVLDLIANAVAARREPARVLSASRSASARAVVLRGRRGEADEAAECVFKALDRQNL